MPSLSSSTGSSWGTSEGCHGGFGSGLGASSGPGDSLSPSGLSTGEGSSISIGEARSRASRSTGSELTDSTESAGLRFVGYRRTGHGRHPGRGRLATLQRGACRLEQWVLHRITWQRLHWSQLLICPSGSGTYVRPHTWHCLAHAELAGRVWPRRTCTLGGFGTTGCV